METYEERDRGRPALGIQQPWGELILRGEKRLEVRSQPTQIRGRIYLYASKKDSGLAEAQPYLERMEGRLARGMVIGSVELTGCREGARGDGAFACVAGERLRGQYVWELARPVRFLEPWPVVYLPYGVWFYPWKRKGEGN